MFGGGASALAHEFDLLAKFAVLIRPVSHPANDRYGPAGSAIRAGFHHSRVDNAAIIGDIQLHDRPGTAAVALREAGITVGMLFDRGA